MFFIDLNVDFFCSYIRLITSIRDAPIYYKLEGVKTLIFLSSSTQPWIEVSIVIAFSTFNWLPAYHLKVFNGAVIVIWQSSIRNHGSFYAIYRLISVAKFLFVEKYANELSLYIDECNTSCYARADQLDTKQVQFS